MDSYWAALGASPSASPLPQTTIGLGWVPAERRRRAPAWNVIVGVVVVVVVLVAGGVAVVARRGGGRSFPKVWDAQVAPIAARVESLRGLTFEHPVTVNYLAPAAFEKRLSPSPSQNKKEEAQTARASALFRAIGLVGGAVDLAAAAQSTQAADTVAFYDFDTKQIYVRGTGPFTIETRVTLAHELTHALQDQYFDLTKLEKQADDSKAGSSDALRGLIEGDAMRIQDRYLAEQSSSDRRAYARLSSESAQQADQRTKDIPEVVDAYFSAPYVFGPAVVRILNSSGGNVAVNGAFNGPIPSTRIYLDPAAITETPLDPPATPALQANEKRLPNDGFGSAFDDFTLYIMVAARLDRPTALRAADAFAAGSQTLYTTAKTTCFRAALNGVNETATRFLAGVIRRWSETMRNAAVDTATDETVTFHSCDPGPGARTPPDENIVQAIRLAASRDEITAGFVNDNIPIDLATCAARVLVQQPALERAIITNSPLTQATDLIARQARIAGATCRNDPTAGIP